jgi:NAD(P)H-quinone oxidoreductase subunit 5
MQIDLLNKYFKFDSLALIMIFLVGFIGAIVAKFAINYLKGDRNYRRFFILFFCLITNIILMVTADHLLIFISAWGLGNLILVKLMIHKSAWRAATESGLLTAKTYLIGLCSISIAFILLYIATGGETSIEVINQHKNDSPLMLIALMLILVAAMTQSAIWPFHKWLISSLNSPLPVSAIMHAGLVNGGGFLIVRFAPLYLNHYMILNIIFIFGLITAIVGTLWKLIQSDIKRMLACSTMAQMGFMMIQCGLGLFSAAIAHIILHGMFKSYLFLSSGSAAREKRLDLHYPPNIKSFICALFCGALGSYIFALVSHKTWLAPDTNFVLISIAFIASTSLALSIMKNNLLITLPCALLSTSFAGAIYGFNIFAVEFILVTLDLFQSQPLNIFHIIGLAILALSWLAMIFAINIPAGLYVSALNSSQPHPKTITTHRNYYQYLRG